MSTPLATVLQRHLDNHRWSFEKLAVAAGLRRSTVHRWTKGGVKKVRYWQDLVKAARALDLDRGQTDELLRAAGHHSLEVVARLAIGEEDLELLASWPEPAPSEPQSTPVSNLPRPLTSFVGREDELALMGQMLATPSVRIVTLTGPGGSGKTRLALEAAHAMEDANEGVCFVELASAHDPDDVCLAIAEALGLGDSQDGSRLHAVIAHLQNKRVLLVLDNFEQVIDAGPLVVKLLEATRSVRALVTSRTRLNVRGEHEIAVPPFALPDPVANFEEYQHNSAVVLFADRARAVDFAFAIDSGNAPLVAAVCVHLEGLPLGIELAAARTRQVGLRSMLERFPARLALADSGPLDAPDRQRTLRSTIDWSYNLLEESERSLFCCISVFVGGFDQAAASAVWFSNGTPFDVSAGLEELVYQNLVRRVLKSADEPRFAMLETIREFALEKLVELSQEQAVRVAHARYFLGLAECAEVDGVRQSYWLRRLANDHENFRTALSWCSEHEQREIGLGLSVALMPFWQLTDRRLEARAWLDIFMVWADQATSNQKALGLLWQGLLLLRESGDVVSAQRYFDEALVLFKREEDLDGASEALQAIGDVHRHQEEWGLASQRYRDSVELAKRANNPYLAAHGYMGLALCAQDEGIFDAAREYWELALEWAERSENRASVSLAVNSLGEMARYRGDWEDAEQFYETALTQARELGNEFRIALALHNLGYVALYRDEVERARALFVDSLLMDVGLQYDKGQAECLAGLARVEVTAGRPQRAARLCGASAAMLDGMKSRLDALDRADYERTIATLASQLGERLEPLLGAGRSMTTAEAVAYAQSGRVANQDE